MAFSRPHLVVAYLAVATIVGLGLGACSGDSGSAGSDGGTKIGSPANEERTTTTTAPATTIAATTAAPTTVAPATTVPAPAGTPTPEAAADTLYQAFVAGDRTAAATVAEPAAVDAVFTASPGPYEPYRGCDTGEFDTSGCLYRDRSTNNTIQFDMERRDQVWVVSGAFFSPG